MQLLLGAVPIILRLFSKAIEDTYSQIIPGIIFQSLGGVDRDKAMRPMSSPYAGLYMALINTVGGKI